MSVNPVNQTSAIKLAFHQTTQNIEIKSETLLL